MNNTASETTSLAQYVSQRIDALPDGFAAVDTWTEAPAAHVVVVTPVDNEVAASIRIRTAGEYLEFRAGQYFRTHIAEHDTRLLGQLCDGVVDGTLADWEIGMGDQVLAWKSCIRLSRGLGRWKLFRIASPNYTLQYWGSLVHPKVWRRRVRYVPYCEYVPSAAAGGVRVPIRPPIIADNRGDLHLFQTVNSTLAYVERDDVASKEWQVWDSDGRPLELRVVQRGRREIIELVAMNGEPRFSAEPVALLQRLLAHRRIPLAELEQLSLSSLVALAYRGRP